MRKECYLAARISIIKNRVDGLQLLRETLGDKGLDYQVNGGYELFTLDDKVVFDDCHAKMLYVNQLVHPIFKSDVFSIKDNKFGFKNICPKLIFSKFEGQIDTGKMMIGLIKKASEENILILNNTEVTAINDTPTIQINNSEEFPVKNVLIATNGFAKQFLKDDILPARAQVIITKPIKNLQIKGTFHLDKGYYYFRNVDNRILLGGGRNLDFISEETTEMGLTVMVQEKLEELLSTTILPNTPFEIDTRWSGIMGVGKQKKAIVKRISPKVFCGVRLGGMGVAIGSSIGKELGNLID